MDEVQIDSRTIDPFGQIIGDKRLTEFRSAMDRARDHLGASRVFHINSTSVGGGVAEMLQSVMSYPKELGIDVHWLVIDGNDPFFELTKRLHHLLHGSQGDGGQLGDEEREIYEKTLQAETDALLQFVRSSDVVVLHDPQVLGLAPALISAGAKVIWNCHIGADKANAQTRQAWSFLSPYLSGTAAQVFSRSAYGWEGLDPEQIFVIPPCIDAFAPKNAPLTPEQATAILGAAGIVEASGTDVRANFHRQDGESDTVSSNAETVELHPVPRDVPVVCQISRWDPLKDHVGVLKSFVSNVPEAIGAHLVIAGPASGSVDDDPEAEETLKEVVAAWKQLPDRDRARVHICCLPMDDVEENAAIVNALQRHSAVVVQKSLAEGFGLTVAEAMWKARPVVGSRVGGIQDQIVPGETGLLIESQDPAAFGEAVSSLLEDRAQADAMGLAGRERVLQEYLAPVYLTRQLSLIEAVSAK